MALSMSLFCSTQLSRTAQTQQHASQKRFVQDHPVVLTPKMEKNAECIVFFFFFFIFWPHLTAYRILVPQPTSPAMEVWSLDH